jgi:hypothetical protein
MRINSHSTLTDTDVREAIARAVFVHGQDIHLEELVTGTRGGIQFWCYSQNGKFSTGRNDSHGLKAATWTAYGYVIAELFSRDPNAHIGHYRGRDHFIRCIYSEQRRYILRQSLGVRGSSGVGSDCSFLSLLDTETACPDCDGSGIRTGIGEGYCGTCEATGTVSLLTQRYQEMQGNPDRW